MRTWKFEPVVERARADACGAALAVHGHCALTDRSDSAADCRAVRPFMHAFKALSITTQPLFIGIEHDLQHLVNPIG